MTWLPTQISVARQAGPQLLSEQYLNWNGHGAPLPGHKMRSEIAWQSLRAVHPASVVIEEQAGPALAPPALLPALAVAPALPALPALAVAPALPALPVAPAPPPPPVVLLPPQPAKHDSTTSTEPTLSLRPNTSMRVLLAERCALGSRLASSLAR
jgi:hypothetical protein